MSICPLKSANLVTVIYVLEVIINMQKKIEGVEKDEKCIRGDMEVMERGIYKIDQGMAWMKEHIPQVIKNNFASPDVPITGVFYIFDFCFNLNLVINVASNPKKVEHWTYWRAREKKFFLSSEKKSLKQDIN